jgi:hypothetical protein
MKLAGWFLVVAVWFNSAKSLSSLQHPKEKVAKPDLSKLSNADLKRCLDRPQLCGAADFDPIDNELVSRLPQFPAEQLLACFADWKICGADESNATGWPISDELARRGDPGKILARFWQEPKWQVRSGIEHVAYHFDTPEVTAFMQRVLAEHKEDGEQLYWPANYLAKKCDAKALQILSSRRQRSQACLQHSTSVALFGKCKYRPAIPYLVRTAMYDACLNIVDSAFESLRTLYPDSPEKFNSLEQAQQYFRKRARQEGYQENDHK